MKIKTTEAAQSLGIHPSHLLLHVARLDSTLTFQDIWPEIDDGFVETVSVSGGRKRDHHSPADQTAKKPGDVPAQIDLSKNALRALDKLWRQNKWGDAFVPLDALAHQAHLSVSETQDVVSELKKRGFLAHDAVGRNTVSLNPGRKKEIERIAKQSAGTLR